MFIKEDGISPFQTLHLWHTFEKPFPTLMSFPWRFLLAMFQMALVLFGGWMRFVILKFLFHKNSSINILLTCDQLNGLIQGVVMLAQGTYMYSRCPDNLLMTTVFLSSNCPSLIWLSLPYDSFPTFFSLIFSDPNVNDINANRKLSNDIFSSCDARQWSSIERDYRDEILYDIAVCGCFLRHGINNMGLYDGSLPNNFRQLFVEYKPTAQTKAHNFLFTILDFYNFTIINFCGWQQCSAQDVLSHVKGGQRGYRGLWGKLVKNNNFKMDGQTLPIWILSKSFNNFKTIKMLRKYKKIDHNW